WTLLDSIKATNDPMLLLLFGVAMVLRRSVSNVRDKGFSRTWTALVWAIGFIFAGNLIDWGTTYGFLPPQLSWIGWHVWFGSGAGCAAACAFQLQAMGRGAEHLDSTRGPVLAVAQQAVRD